MNWTLLQPIAGHVASLSERARSEIAKLVPVVPLDHIDGEFQAYLLLRDADQPTLESVRAELGSLLKSLRALQTKVGLLTDAARHIVEESAVLTIRSKVLEVLPGALGQAEVCVAVAQSRMPKGHRLTARTRLVRNLAWIVHEVELPVDAKPSGPLVSITEIMLQDAREDPSDTRKVVAEALARWKLRPPANRDISTRT